MAIANPSSSTATTSDAAYRRGVLLVVLSGVMWSCMGLGIRFIEQANVWQILLIRSITLSMFLFVVITIRAKGHPWPVIRATGLAGAIGGLGLVFAFSGGIYAIQVTTVANAMFLFATSPFFAAVLGWVILREPVRRGTWIAMAVAALGIGAMVREGIAAGNMLGNMMAAVAALGFAVFTVAIRQGQSGDMIPIVFLGGVFAAVAAGIVCATSGYTLALPTQDITIAIVLGVFQLGAGLVVYTIGSRHVPAAEAALLSMTEVILAPLWVWVFLGETASTATLLGGAVVMAALAGNALSGARRKIPPVI